MPTPVGKRQSPHEAKIERELGYCAVCLIGYTKRVPRRFGDNQGGRPVKFVTSKKPRASANVANAASPYHRVVVLHSVYVRSDVHAHQLKDKLDELLLGGSLETKLRHGWRDVDDPDMTWDLLLAEALRALRYQAFDEREKQDRIKATFEKQVRSFRARR